jgi:large subunit ribosomal protein L29
MKIKEIRVLQAGEIDTKLDDAREELFKLRFQLATGQLTDTARARLVKRDIARYLTVLRERQLAAELAAESATASAAKTEK